MARQLEPESRVYLQEQHEADPLVVSVLLPLVFRIRPGVVDAGERHLGATAFPVRRRDRVRAVDPAVSVEDVLGQILAVYAVDRIADVLASGDDQRERYQQDHREAVMQTEHRAVDVDVRDLYEALQAAEYVQHLGTARSHRRGDQGTLGPSPPPQKKIIPSPSRNLSLFFLWWPSLLTSFLRSFSDLGTRSRLHRDSDWTGTVRTFPPGPGNHSRQEHSTNFTMRISVLFTPFLSPLLFLTRGISLTLAQPFGSTWIRL